MEDLPPMIEKIMQMNPVVHAHDQLLQRLLDKLPVGVYTCDTQGLLTSYNRQAAAIWGRTPRLHHSLERFCGSFQLFDPQDGTPIAHDESWMARALSEEKGYNDCELLIGRPDGRRVTVLVHANPIHDGSGKLLGAFNVLMDITDRKAAATALRDAEAARATLEAQLLGNQKLQAVGTLAAGIAHDFNNLLASIFGNVQLARLELKQEGEVAARLNTIEKASSRARDLVRQILAFSKPQAAEHAPCNIGLVVDEGIQLLRATLPAGIELRTHVAPDVPAIVADATQIQQALVNLCTNAWHAMHDRSAGRIDISLAPHDFDVEAVLALPDLVPGRYVELAVSDSGEGIDPALLDRIFEPFFTTKPPGLGTGLGLSVVRSIVCGHGGTITVTSTPGAGTTFRLYFPVSGFAAARAARHTHGNAEPRHVLYIDDEEPLVEIMQELLTREGYRVTTCTNAADALAVYAQDPSSFDLVLSDINLPGASGMALCTNILKLRPTQLIALLSGYVSDTDRMLARRAGVRHVLEKPMTVAETIRVIEKMFEQPEVEAHLHERPKRRAGICGR